MSYQFASRLEGVRISMIRQIMLRAEGCINLGLGEPDFFSPKIVRDEAHRVLREEKIQYSPNPGIPELREAIHRYHGNCANHSVCVTNGSQEALFDILFALVDPEDEVLVPNPGFVAYPTVVRLAGGRPIPYPLPHQKHFQFEEEALKGRLSSRTRAIILNTPSNPTGQCLTHNQLGFIAHWAEQNNVVIVSDEIYREIYYTDQKPATMAAATNGAVILSGVSKMASMTGWRLGWACGPHEIVEQATVLHQYTSTCAPTLSQKAALKILTEAGEAAVAHQRQILSESCDFTCSWIEEELDRSYVRPEGAFYLMLSVEDLGLDSFSVSSELISDGVATIPGAAFGSEGEGFLRLSFACDRSQIEAGLARLKKGLKRLIRRNAR